ncbi:sulfatase [Adhaeretor mobilis]|uniref:Arylsulfatase n=1 Tax=Adhaeretor mobilis TaxID=1930276 RepID=A0A517N180_9BACT|nr:sulfatase [Adhaeretor mobilis]QDT00891.1 Arylsulfatase [Adhaeretor mobilis]
MVKLIFGLLVVLSVNWNARLLAETTATATPKRLNVLFLIADDLRPELGCYGNTVIKSPHIDRLAERSLVFNRAYCQQAVCSPSRTSVLTGTRPDTSRVWDLRTHFREALPLVVTLPQLFKEHGYECAGLGKIYHGGLGDAPSWSVAAGAFSTPRKNRTRRKNSLAATNNNVPREWANRLTQTNRGQAFRATDDPPNGGGEGKLADEAIAALRQFKASGKPFFLGVGFHKPHLPFSVPKHYWDLYNPEQIPPAPNPFLPSDAPSYALVEKNEMWNYSGVPDVKDLPEYYTKQLKHGYYAAVSYMDAQLGRVLEELDALDLREDTIVILWGDHGWKLGEHNRWCKHSNVEDDARAPLIISAPGTKGGGKKTDALVEFVDIYPTLAELADIPLPEHLEGTSVKPLLKNPKRSWKSAAFSQYPRTVQGKRLMGYSMRTNRYRFTRWVDRKDHTKVDAVELYDHQTDPQENTNIADDPAHATLVDELTQQWLAGWQGALPVSSK